MIFLMYLVFSIIAYFLFWQLIMFIISLPGMGLGLLLMHFATKGETILKKAIFPIIGFVSYILNFTLNALVWGAIISFITSKIMIVASHPILYFILGAFFSLSIVAPSGESNFFAGIQSLFVYLFYTSGVYLKILELTSGNSPRFLNLILIISPIIFLLALAIGAIVSIRGMFTSMKKNSFSRKSLRFVKS